VEGRKLGRFKILGKIGAGGMGEVWRAHDESLDRDVALKILPGELAKDPERRQRFEREAKAVAGLQHPNIVTIHSIEESGDDYFLTMELIKGQTLDAILPTDGFALSRFFELSIPLADAVHAAHEQGVVHRDLKPGNVMVDASGRLRILDFGLAKLVGAGLNGNGDSTIAQDEFSTQQGRILGTVAYMSPEQAEGKPVDPRSDIFSLGVLLYEMATGQRPFKGDSPISTLSAILKETPPVVSSIKPLPRHLGRIIARCLEKDPAKRFQTARDVCNELEGLRREVDSGDTEILMSSLSGLSGLGELGELGDSKDSAPVSRPKRSRLPLLIGALAVVLAAAGATAYWTLLNRTQPEGPLRIRPLTGAAGVEYAGSWSPDGSFFAYCHSANGPLDIFIQSTAGGDPVRLVESPADDWMPAWSPDNRWIAFASNQGGMMGIYLVPPLGGQVRKLVDTGLSGLSDESTAVLSSTPWSPDGGRLAFARQSEGRIAIWIYDFAGGAETQLTHPTAGSIDGMPCWSHDGSRIAFIRMAESGSGLMVVEATGGKPRAVLDESVSPWGIGWSPDDKQLIFISDRETGISNIWTVGVSSGRLRQLTFGTQSIQAATVSSGGRVLYNDFSHQTDLYLQDLESGEARRLTHHTQSNFSARFSADGNKIAYNSDRTGNNEIWVLDLISETEQQITNHEASDYDPDWSPDGRRLVFTSDRNGAPALWLADTAGGMARIVEGTAGARSPRWTPDGTGIGYIATADSGPALWLIDPEGGDPRKILADVADFAWFGDTSRVIYTPQSSNTEIRAVDLKTRQLEILYDGAHVELALDPNLKGLTFCAAESHFNMNLRLIRLQTNEEGLPQPAGGIESLTAGEGLWHVHNGSWSPDGRSVVYTRDTDTGDVYMVEGAF
jgi:Tol biopolymer transport system component/serine/threonine protein kinase